MKLNLVRTMIGVVVLVNVWCALAFLIRPGDYTAGFELSGALGEGIVRGLGVLFLMWNVPYAVALWHPVRHRISLMEALIMQTIGLVGESTIYASLPVIHSLARSSLVRFILFDFAGFLLLAGAVWLTRGPALHNQG